MDKKVNEVKTKALPYYVKVSSEMHRWNVKERVTSPDWIKGQFFALRKLRLIES